MKYHLAIVGGGSAAFSAAIRARQKGLNVVMVERAEIGGTCVNVGGILSKALLAAAEARHAANQQRFPGIKTTSNAVDVAALVNAKDAIIRDLRRDKYLDLAREYEWEIVRGSARYATGPVLEVDGQTLEAEHYLVATGSVPSVPRIEGLGDVPYLTSTSAMDLTELPESLVVVGGNYIGLELGQLFARLGSRVTIVESLERLAPHEEPELSTMLTEVLQDEGVTVRTAATVTDVRPDGRGADVTLNRNGQWSEVRASQLLIAAGRRPDNDAHTKELRAFRRTLHQHLAACENALAAAGDSKCPTIEALDGSKRVSKTYEAR